MKKKETPEIISKEDVKKLVESLENAQKEHPEMDKETNVDTDKVKEVIASFEGCTVHTATIIITTAMLLLPAGAILAALDMGKSALKMKAITMLGDLIKEKETTKE